MDHERKFKVGDVVRPAPNKGWSPHLMPETLTVIELYPREMVVKWVIGNYYKFSLSYDDFVLAEETVVDNILTKYGW